MENKTCQTKSASKSKKVSQGSLSNISNLPALIATMKHSNSWAKGELNAIILSNRSDQKIVLTMIHENTEILSFQGGYSTTFQVIEGALTFLNHNRSVFIDEGHLLTDYDKLSYKLSNRVDTVFLLTTEHKIN
jgi:hypothetical protein